MSKSKQFVSPVGTAVFPRLKAGSPDTKFDSNGVYKVDLDVPAADVQEMLDVIEQQRDEFADKVRAQMPPAKAKKLRVSDLPFEENEDGSIRIKFKMKAKVESKKGTFTQVPAVFDAKGAPMFNIIKNADGSETHEPIDIWGGSRIRVAFDAIPYESPLMGIGVTFRLKAVKVIELVAGGQGKTANGFGFGEEEEGYAHEVSEVEAQDLDQEFNDADEELKQGESNGAEGDF